MYYALPFGIFLRYARVTVALVENTTFLRDVLRAYSFISRKHAFGKIDPPLTSQIAENKILGPIPLDPHEKVSMDAESIVQHS